MREDFASSSFLALIVVPRCGLCGLDRTGNLKPAGHHVHLHESIMLEKVDQHPYYLSA